MGLRSGVVYGFKFEGREVITDILEDLKKAFGQSWDVHDVILNGGVRFTRSEKPELAYLFDVQNIAVKIHDSDVHHKLVMFVHSAPLAKENTDAIEILGSPLNGTGTAGWGVAELVGAYLGWDLETPGYFFYSHQG